MASEFGGCSWDLYQEQYDTACRDPSLKFIYRWPVGARFCKIAIDGGLLLADGKYVLLEGEPEWVFREVHEKMGHLPVHGMLRSVLHHFTYVGYEYGSITKDLGRIMESCAKCRADGPSKVNRFNRLEGVKIMLIPCTSGVSRFTVSVQMPGQDNEQESSDDENRNSGQRRTPRRLKQKLTDAPATPVVNEKKRCRSQPVKTPVVSMKRQKKVQSPVDRDAVHEQARRVVAEYGDVRRDNQNHVLKHLRTTQAATRYRYLGRFSLDIPRLARLIAASGVNQEEEKVLDRVAVRNNEPIVISPNLRRSVTRWMQKRKRRGLRAGAMNKMGTANGDPKQAGSSGSSIQVVKENEAPFVDHSDSSLDLNPSVVQHGFPEHHADAYNPGILHNDDDDEDEVMIVHEVNDGANENAVSIQKQIEEAGPDVPVLARLFTVSEVKHEEEEMRRKEREELSGITADNTISIPQTTEIQDSANDVATCPVVHCDTDDERDVMQLTDMNNRDFQNRVEAPPGIPVLACLFTVSGVKHEEEKGKETEREESTVITVDKDNNISTPPATEIRHSVDTANEVQTGKEMLSMPETLNDGPENVVALSTDVADVKDKPTTLESKVIDLFVKTGSCGSSIQVVEESEEPIVKSSRTLIVRTAYGIFNVPAGYRPCKPKNHALKSRTVEKGTTQRMIRVFLTKLGVDEVADGEYIDWDEEMINNAPIGQRYLDAEDYGVLIVPLDYEVSYGSLDEEEDDDLTIVFTVTMKKM